MAGRKRLKHYCNKCRQFLPLDRFTLSPKRKGELRSVCEKCRAKDKRAIKKQFVKMFGGERIIILNHIKQGEFRFQYWMDGTSWATNDPAEFKCILAKHSLLRGVL